MRILGISAFYHDSAAAIIEDGRVLCAAEEERFSRKKHDNTFPHRAIDFCIAKCGASIEHIDAVAYYEKPLRKFERIIETFAATYPYSIKPFLKTMPASLSEKLPIENIIRKKIGHRGPLYFIPHHLSHAAMAFYPSPYEQAAILTVDGVGEYQTTALWRGNGTKIEELASIEFPHSLGLLYSTVTAFLGFQVNNDEYKVMGLAAHGTPIYEQELSNTVHVKDDGSFQLDLSYYGFRESFQMWTRKFETLFGKPRAPGSPLAKRDRDLAASVQAVTETIYFGLLARLHEITHINNVCIAGGVAQNATANGKIFSNTRFTSAYVPGVAGDNGAAIGAALFCYHGIHGNPKRHRINSLSLGSTYTDEDIKAEIEKHALHAVNCASDEELVEHVSRLLAEGKIVGWFQGEMEFGQRALGHRSILCDPRRPEMKDRMNRLKTRADFHPFAAAVLKEYAHEYFQLQSVKSEYPFMTFCFPVRLEKRSMIPAVVHADGSCRIQTVSKESVLLYSLLQKFEELSGVPCLLNTSFNRKGEPIVETPAQAIDDFLAMPMDHLAIGRHILTKKSTG